jgi:phospho-acceptor domain-containing protein
MSASRARTPCTTPMRGRPISCPPTAERREFARSGLKTTSACCACRSAYRSRACTLRFFPPVPAPLALQTECLTQVDLLRTPLAALRLRLENLEGEVDGPAAEDVEGTRAEVERLTRLVDGLLTLARAEQAASAPADVDVGGLMSGRRDAWAAFADDPRISRSRCRSSRGCMLAPHRDLSSRCSTTC